MSDTLLISRRADGDCLEVELARDVAALEPARRAVLAFLAPHDVAGTRLFDIELVLEETLMNVVRHAAPPPGADRIGLRVSIGADAVTLRFEDEGVAFDPRQAAEPKRPTSLADAVPGGLGLMLVRKRAKSTDYERRDGRNILTITVARH